MRNTIRCCISCILPCGALDVIRIVHSNGRVEEISGTVRASEIMKAHPKHVLKKPSSSSSSDEHGVVPKVVIVPADAELQRGKIYFLMPVPSTPGERNKRQKLSGRKKRREQTERVNGYSHNISNISSRNNNSISMVNFLSSSSDRYLSDILSEKLSTQRDRRQGRVAVWRPHLQSISESPTDNM